MKKYVLAVGFFWVSLNLLAQKIHAHNDYLNAKPFYTAFEAKANSIEVDVFLENGKLMVAHTKEEIKAKNTLSSLYLDPLSMVYNGIENLQILIDIKTEPIETLDAVIAELKKYPTLINSQVRFVISGERPALSLYATYPDFIYFDHQNIEDLEPEKNPKIALMSFRFGDFTAWDGLKSIPMEDKAILKAQIQAIHDLGYAIRFWGSPDTPLAWQAFRTMGVDYINTDQVKRCWAFLNLDPKRLKTKHNAKKRVNK